MAQPPWSGIPGITAGETNTLRLLEISPGVTADVLAQRLISDGLRNPNELQFAQIRRVIPRAQQNLRERRWNDFEDLTDQC